MLRIDGGTKTTKTRQNLMAWYDQLRASQERKARQEREDLRFAARAMGCTLAQAAKHLAEPDAHAR